MTEWLPALAPAMPSTCCGQGDIDAAELMFDSFGQLSFDLSASIDLGSEGNSRNFVPAPGHAATFCPGKQHASKVIPSTQTQSTAQQQQQQQQQQRRQIHQAQQAAPVLTTDGSLLPSEQSLLMQHMDVSCLQPFDCGSWMDCGTGHVQLPGPARPAAR